MEQRTLGKTGLKVSTLGFGGSEIGFQGASHEVVAALLNAALDAGLNVIDTAECYIDSEEKIGATVSHRRAQFHLFTKVGHEEGLSKPEDYSSASIARSIDRSLVRLRTDHLDLVQLHSPGLDVLERGEAIAALQRAKQQGKTRFIGYSGDDQPAIWAVRSGAFDTLQTSVNIADQQSIDLTLPIACEKGMGVIAKRPIANAAWRDAEQPKGSYHEPYWLRLRELAYDFIAAGGERAASTALRFTLSLTSPAGAPLVHTAIVGTKNPERWRENARLLEQGPLPKHQIDDIRAHWSRLARPDWVGQI